MISFRPRMSGVQQVTTVNVRSWDPKSKAERRRHARRGAQTTSKPGVQRSQVANDLGGGTTTVTDRVAANNGEANAIAKSTLGRTADSFYEADGVAFGDPDDQGRHEGQDRGRRHRSSAARSWSRRRRTATAARPATRRPSRSPGRSSRTLLELIRQPEERDWSSSLVVGVVTNNNDPEQMGRVRVKYPSLSDTEESAWARIATPSAGNARGLLMLPQANEEVIVGFEHGDARRPIVVGSVFNGRDKPGADLLPEPRRIVRDALEREGAHAHEEGLRDQVRPEHDRRDHEGREGQGRRQRRAHRDRQQQAEGPAVQRRGRLDA